MDDRARLAALVAIARRDRGAADVPELAAALEAAERDPELAAIARREADFDRAMTAGLASVQPPADLLGRLLANGNRPIAESDAPDSQAHPPTRERGFWRALVPGLAAAATLALAAGVLLRLPKPSGASSASGQGEVPARPQTEAYAAGSLPEYLRAHGVLGAVSRTLDGPHPFQHPSAELETLRRFLEANAAPVPGELPASVASLPALGCLKVEVDGRPISMICFRGDQVYHLFVADSVDFPGAPSQREPSFCAAPCGRPVATWQRDGALYVLTSDRADGNLAQFF